MSEKNTLVDGKYLITHVSGKSDDADIAFVISNGGNDNIGNKDFRFKLRGFIVDKFTHLVPHSDISISGYDNIFMVFIYFKDESLAEKILDVIKNDNELQSLIIRWC